jgi:hypothetical protein
MKFMKIILAVVLSLLLIVSVCSSTQKVPLATHVVRVHLEPSQYAEFLSRLDAEMAQIGLSRDGGRNADLSELQRREVFVFDYRLKLAENLGFLIGNDIVKLGLIEIYVDASFFKDERVRGNAMNRLETVLHAYGAHLEARTEKNFGAKMDMSVYKARS